MSPKVNIGLVLHNVYKCLLSVTLVFIGLDIPAIYNVIQYGMPADIDQYVQESGRVGRDGTSSQACTLYHRHCNVGSSMTDEAKEFIKLKTCRRKYLMDYFAETSD